MLNGGLPSALAEHYLDSADSFGEQVCRLTERPPPRDETLQHPNCVYQILKRHYARYTPEMVERVTGCPQQTFLAVANAFARASGREKTGAICYAVGWTHHTTGVQIIRAAAIIQGLLGNTGRPGGGILALRGHTSIQGSTDIPTLFNMLPSYIPQPHANQPQGTLQEYLELETVPTGWWINFPKYFISLLKAFYGGHATKENDFGYRWLPKIVGDHSQLPMTMQLNDGLMKGLFVLGQNPVIGGSNSDMVESGLAKLEWLVVRDIAETETASFWKDGRLIRVKGMRPQDIGTEVFLMPGSLAGEKAGSFTNTHRLVQWHDQVVEGPGDSRSELWFIYHLGKRLKALYADSTRVEDEAIKALTLDYPEDGERGEPRADAVLKEINGRSLTEHRQLQSFSELKDDGTTACGSWIYCGVFADDNHNQARSRKPDGPDGPGTHLGWAFAWPANRRTLYNRASADPTGKPWSEGKKLIWWDEAKGRWVGNDAIDFEEKKRPDYEPDWSDKPVTGTDAISGGSPYIMMADGKAALFVPSGLKDGPLPTHYEPIESPVRNPLHARQRSPAAKEWSRDDDPIAPPADPRFPYVLTCLHPGISCRDRRQHRPAPHRHGSGEAIGNECGGLLGITSGEQHKLAPHTLRNGHARKALEQTEAQSS